MDKKNDEKMTAVFQSNLQDIVDTMANILNIPAGLIMKINNEKIEVIATSKTENNPVL